jgi:hypothetical protein
VAAVATVTSGGGGAIVEQLGHGRGGSDTMSKLLWEPYLDSYAFRVYI